MQIKTTVRFHVTPVRISLTKKYTNNKCWRECQKQWNTFWPLVGLLIGTNTMENRWKCLKKLKKKCHMIQQSHSWASVQFSSVQSLSHVWLFTTPWIAAHQASLSITNSRSTPRLTSIESVMPSSRLILCRPLLLLSPIPPSIKVFSNESALWTLN